MRVEVNHLVRRFQRTLAVDDVSFTLEPGCLFGFVGPNGAGKTTTIRIMAALDEATLGDVCYDGVSVSDYPDEVRRVVGYMPDTLPENADLRVWEYLDFFARAFQLRGAWRRRTLGEIEEFVGIGPLREKFLNQLSKGMKQRVALARALLHNPSVLILDEPAAGLDPRARLELRDLLKVLATQRKTIFLSSHILSELQDMCDGAVIIERGRILSAGTFSALAEGRTRDPEQGGRIRLTLLRDPDPVLKFALEQPQVRGGRRIGANQLQLEFRGGDAECAALMVALFQSGAPITEFRRQEFGLEELFMSMTGGK